MANLFQSNVVTGMGNIGCRARANDCFRLQWLIATFTLYPFSDIIHPKVGLFRFSKGEVPTAEGQRQVKLRRRARAWNCLALAALFERLCDGTFFVRCGPSCLGPYSSTPLASNLTHI